MEQQIFEKRLMKQIIDMALEEDQVQDDITTNSLLDCDRHVLARVTAKEDGVISGIEAFISTFHTVDHDLKITVSKGDGCQVKKGDEVLEIRGRESSILKAERTALNFLQRLSGIATLTQKYVNLLKPHHTTLLDTRKTTPGMRYLEKKAVKDGGGTNHRLNLKDMAMVKDNHIKMAGSITAAVNRIRQHFPTKKIEVEVTNLAQLAEALDLNVDIIMLDNFAIGMVEKAVNQTRNHTFSQAKLEISGNVTLENIQQKACTGIDFISVGALTHSFKSLDLSLNIIDVQEQ